MTGVEILSSETIYNTILPAPWMAIGFILMFVFAGLFIVSTSSDHDIFTLICLVLAVGCFIVTLLADTDNKHDVNYIEYKVTIDDSVSMNEFLDKYEILDQEGKIYTVKERE